MAITLYQDLDIDFKRIYPNDLFRFHQGDKSSWSIRVACYVDSSRFTVTGLTAKYKATINNVLAEEEANASISDNKIVIPVTENMAATGGKLLVDVWIIDGNSVLYTQTLRGIVEESCVNNTTIIDNSGSSWATGLQNEAVARQAADAALGDAITAEQNARSIADSNKANRNLDNVIDGSIKQNMIDGHQVGEDELTVALMTKIDGKVDKQSGVTSGRIAVFNGEDLIDGGKSLESYNESATDYGLSDDNRKVPSSKIIKKNLDDVKNGIEEIQEALPDKLETAPDGDIFLIGANGKIQNAYHNDDILGSLIFGGTITAFDSSDNTVTILLSDAAKARLGVNTSTGYYAINSSSIKNMFFKTNVNFVYNYNQFSISDIILCTTSVNALMFKQSGMARTYVPFINKAEAPPTGLAAYTEYKIGTIYMDTSDDAPYVCLTSTYSGTGYIHTWLNLKTGEVLSA